MAYKILLNNIKKKALEEDGHLLNISLGSPLTKEKPSEAARKQVEKATAKLNPDERIKLIENCSRNIILYAKQML